MRKSLEAIRDSVRQRADLEHDLGFVAEDELTDIVMESIGRLWDLIIDANGSEMVMSQASVTLAPGDREVELPEDLLKLLFARVARAEGGSRVLKRGHLQDALEDGLTGEPRFYCPAGLVTYALPVEGVDTGKAMWVWPSPQKPTVVHIDYIPEPPRMTRDEDEIDFPSRWIAWVELDAAITCAAKEETDPSALMAQRDRVEAAIAKLSGRASHTVRTVRDSRGLLQRRRLRLV